MNLDVRLPMGALFSLLGTMVMVYGLYNSYRLDVEWGGAMLVFGILCTALAFHSMRVNRRAVAYAPVTTPPAKGE